MIATPLAATAVPSYRMAAFLPPAALARAAAVEYDCFSWERDTAGVLRPCGATDATGGDPLHHLAVALGHADAPLAPEPSEFATLVGPLAGGESADFFLACMSFARDWDRGLVADLDLCRAWGLASCA